jgi:hypothetical protein
LAQIVGTHTLGLFQKLWMSFMLKGITVDVQGEHAPNDKYIEKPKAINALRGGLWDMLLQIRAIKLGERHNE